MSEQLEDLAVWTTHLIRASYDYREHCCEFSKFLVQDVPDDYWPDVAAQLIVMLGDIDYMNEKCSSLLFPLKPAIVKAVAQLSLPKPDGHLSWTTWTVEHWLHLCWLVKLGLQSYVSAVPSDPDQWFHQMSEHVRRCPELCKEIARHLFTLGERFIEFDECDRLIKYVHAECRGVQALSAEPNIEIPRAAGNELLNEEIGLESSAAGSAEVVSKNERVFESTFANDRPIRWEDIEELCAGKFNRVGKLVAKNGSTCRGWQYAKGWPNPMTWQSVRKWVNERKSFDFGDPPEEC